jgi:hypothetical protein
MKRSKINKKHTHIYSRKEEQGTSHDNILGYPYQQRLFVGHISM